MSCTDAGSCHWDTKVRRCSGRHGGNRLRRAARGLRCKAGTLPPAALVSSKADGGDRGGGLAVAGAAPKALARRGWGRCLSNCCCRRRRRCHCRQPLALLRLLSWTVGAAALLAAPAGLLATKGAAAVAVVAQRSNAAAPVGLKLVQVVEAAVLQGREGGGRWANNGWLAAVQQGAVAGWPGQQDETALQDSAGSPGSQVYSCHRLVDRAVCEVALGLSMPHVPQHLPTCWQKRCGLPSMISCGAMQCSLQMRYRL